jgi:predicted small secreted protein
MLYGLRKLTLLLTLMGAMTALAACDDTLRGMGQDAEEMGDEAEDATQ